MVTGDPVSAELSHFNIVFREQGSKNSRFGADRTGRTAGLQAAVSNVLSPGNEKNHLCTLYKWSGKVISESVYNLCFPGQDIMAVSADNVGCRSWSGESAQLLGADWYPLFILQELQTGGIGFTLAVIPGTESG